MHWEFAPSGSRAGYALSIAGGLILSGFILFCVTARAALVAIAASTTLPPLSRILEPIMEAWRLEEATMPFEDIAFGLVRI